MNDKDNESEKEKLRKKAEELLKTAAPPETVLSPALSQTEILKLIHELQVHQVELEMQNEELRQASAVRQIAVDRYTELYEFAPSGYLSLSQEGRIAELNFSAAQMLGKERRRLKNSSFASFVSDETKPVFQLFFEKVFVSETKETCELTLTNDGNSTIQVQLTGRLTEKGDQCLVSMIDITERLKLEKAVSEREEKYRTLFTASRDALFLIDRNSGDILDVNDAVCNLYGYTREELYKLKNTDLSFEPVATSLATKNLRGRIELRYHKKKDGTVFPVDISSTLLIMDGEEVILAAIRDITDRKAVEDALTESEGRFKSLFERHSAIMLLIDPESGQIINANHAAAAFYGYSIPELCSMSIDMINALSADEVKAERLQAASENRNFFVFPHRLAGGEERIVEVHSSPIDFLGNKVLFSIILDITARRQAEAEINLKNAELLKLNAEKDKFFSIIAHDLRSPFNAFLGFTKMMAEELDTLSPDQIQAISISMQKSATNLYGLLENLLEWSRIRRGVTSFEPVQSPLMPMIEESLKPVGEQAGKKGIEIIFDSPAGCTVFADRYMLGTIVRNLVTNAIKFSARDGRIFIVAKPVSGNLVEISISDAGIGMNEQMVDNLYRLDEQANRKGTEGEPSTGLGLLICKEFVEKHGGKLRVVSEEGVGTTFYFPLPAGRQVD
ncbi:MAG: PAS domain S-box protein [Bacteroidota bacterium]